MSLEILTVTTPMGADPERPEIPYVTLSEDLDGDGVPERVEVETEPRLSGSPFREWRVFRDGGAGPIAVVAGVEVGIRHAESGAPVLVSDGAFWRVAPNGLMYPYGDLVLSRSMFTIKGTEADRELLDRYGAEGIFRDNVRTITVPLGQGRSEHRVIAGGGFAFADPEDGTALFIIATSDHVPVLVGRSMSHPWLFRNGAGFTLISDSLFGYQISLIPEGVL